MNINDQSGFINMKSFINKSRSRPNEKLFSIALTHSWFPKNVFNAFMVRVIFVMCCDKRGITLYHTISTFHDLEKVAF